MRLDQVTQVIECPTPAASIRLARRVGTLMARGSRLATQLNTAWKALEEGRRLENLGAQEQAEEALADGYAALETLYRGGPFGGKAVAA